MTAAELASVVANAWVARFGAEYRTDECFGTGYGRPTSDTAQYGAEWVYGEKSLLYSVTGDSTC